jgi:hypothetical protein
VRRRRDRCEYGPELELVACRDRDALVRTERRAVRAHDLDVELARSGARDARRDARERERAAAVAVYFVGEHRAQLSARDRDREQPVVERKDVVEAAERERAGRQIGPEPAAHVVVDRDVAS